MPSRSLRWELLARVVLFGKPERFWGLGFRVRFGD